MQSVTPHYRRRQNRQNDLSIQKFPCLNCTKQQDRGFFFYQTIFTRHIFYTSLKICTIQKLLQASYYICESSHHFCSKSPDDMSLILIKADFFLPASPIILPSATDQFVRKILSGFHLCPGDIAFWLRM